MPCSSEVPWFLEVSTVSKWMHVFQSHTRWRAGPSQYLGRSIRTRAGLSLWGLEKGSSWSNTISFLPIQERTIELLPGEAFRILTVWGLSCDGNGGLVENGVLSSRDSEHSIKDARKAKRSLGPVPCLYLSLPRHMVVILHLKISRAASHSALGQHVSPLQSRNSSWCLSGNTFNVAQVCLPSCSPQWRWEWILCVMITLIIPGGED